MKTKAIILLILCCFMITATPAIAEIDKGAENLTLKGGNMGNIAFPHQQHQTALKNDCKACHDMFPQKPGVIEKYKAEKKLKKKQVMNKKCLKCHRAKKKEGVKTGPTSCSQCHNK